MAQRHFVFSTLATDMRYTHWIPGADAGAMASEGPTVFIKGGAGVANDRIVTPLGVMTEVDDAELEMLHKNNVFLLHKTNGHMSVQKKSTDVEKVAADMNRADPSSPKTPADYIGVNEETTAKPSAKNS
jgi:hypothetical protein